MFHDEFVFEFRGQEYKFQDLDSMDGELAKAVSAWENNVRRGWIKVFIEKQTKTDNHTRKIPLGQMQLDDIQKKFG